MKRWGYIRAKPSEYLIHVRNGRVRTQTSGQGASCFKWPSDAVAIVPTSLQRLEFVADQVTLEKVGIEVTGLAVYRIADPLLAYRVLNFSYPERAQAKLEETLTGMFVGATRRLVANLTIEACLQKRKNALAVELLHEIAPVVGGRGHPEDVATEGWGVVLDTIEIQEVRILSSSVFEALQAPYRAEIEQRAADARLKAEMELATRRQESEREVAEARIRAQAIVEEKASVARRQNEERAAAEEILSLERAQTLRLAEHQAELERGRQGIAREQEAAEQRAALEIRRSALRAEEAEAKLRSAAVEAEQAAREAERDRLAAELRLAVRRLEVEAERLSAEAEASAALRMAEVERIRAEANQGTILAQRLPDLAGAIGNKIGEVRIHQYGGGESNPFAMLTESVQAVVDLVGRRGPG